MIQFHLSCRDGLYHAGVFGHAGYGEHGKDIVCSAASMLACTLTQCLRSEEEKGNLRLLSIRQENGRMEAGFLPTLAGMERVSVLLQTVETGFSLLAESYPEYVCIQKNKRLS
jgi:uncharacterized protein YsxB (DUF464 family)